MAQLEALLVSAHSLDRVGACGQALLVLLVARPWMQCLCSLASCSLFLSLQLLRERET